MSPNSHRVMTMDKGRLSTCIYLCFAAVLITASQGQPTRPDQRQQQQQPGVTSNYSSNALARPQIKKDVFMSRGWGAAGMPFNMVYLNHYTKAHKAYAQNLQLQQQQQEQLRQREADQIRLRSGGVIREQGLDQPRTLPYGTRYADAVVASEPQTNAQQSEFGNGQREDEYADSGVYLSAKPSSPRRQYNVPQLFVSYGWGPMG